MRLRKVGVYEETLLSVEGLLLPRWMEPEGGGGAGCQHRSLGRGQFIETPLSIGVPQRQSGLVAKAQELWQVPPAVVLVAEGRAAGHKRGHADGAARHGEVNREGHRCRHPTWQACVV